MCCYLIALLGVTVWLVINCKYSLISLRLPESGNAKCVQIGGFFRLIWEVLAGLVAQPWSGEASPSVPCAGNGFNLTAVR